MIFKFPCCFQVLSDILSFFELLYSSNWGGSRVVMDFSMKSLMGSFLPGLKLPTHQLLQILFIWLKIKVIPWLSMKLKYLRRLQVKVKTSFLWFQVQISLGREYQILVSSVYIYFKSIFYIFVCLQNCSN